MLARFWLILSLAVLVLSTCKLAAETAPPAAMQVQEKWLGDIIHPTGAAKIPFSFTFGGQPSSRLLPEWKRLDATAKIDAHRTAQTIIWTDPASGLEVRWAGVIYHDYSVVEWTLHFKNNGDKNAPLLEDVQAIDTRFERRDDGEFSLHAFTGSSASANDYAPNLVPLGPKATATLHSSGWSSQENLPYFNIDWGGEGAVVAVGWPGNWTANFVRDDDKHLQLRSGMTHLAVALKAGEEIRSPLIALQFWKGGDWIDAQNVWRHWMLDYNIPRTGGQVPKPFTATCVDGMFPGMRSNAKDEIASLELYSKHNSALDFWWIDAGWYSCRDNWGNVGTWEPDPQRYPKGIKEVADVVHAHGMKLVLWFQPEHATGGTWLTEHHPEWVFGGAGGGLLNLGNPEAQKWLIEHFDQLITSQGVDLYRQDDTINPAGIWAAADTEGRAGMTEMRYVEGYLAFWDALRTRHPDMLIDSCASGGRRNDLETLRRAVPLLRSDYRFEPNGTQGHNYGISFWMPFNGTGVEPVDPYVMRSHFCPCFAYGGACMDPHFDFDGRNKMAREWREISDNLLHGNYYPLADYSLSPKVWMAWQFNRAEASTGVVQAFRRSEADTESMTLKLRGLDPIATYELRDYDQPELKKVTGRELMDTGLQVTLPRKATAATIAYRRVQ